MKVALAIAAVFLAAGMMLWGAVKVHRAAYLAGFQNGHDWTLQVMQAKCEGSGKITMWGKPYHCMPIGGKEL